MLSRKKDKIINDPIYGFVHLEKGIILELIEHPFFQRLRRISQLGLSYLVYRSNGSSKTYSGFFASMPDNVF